MFYGIEALDITFWSVSEATFASMLIGLWHDIRGKTMPRLQWIPEGKKEPKLVRSENSVRERKTFLWGCGVLGGFVGLLVALYFLGFTDKQTIPNFYGRSFVSLLAGFLMPNILVYLERLNIKNVLRP